MKHLGCAVCLALLPVLAAADQRASALVAAALARTDVPVRYDGSYRALSYPGGDVPDNVGVCTDLVIRAYRTLDIDLQQLVHEDMSTHFADYPSRRIWGLHRPDSNIDHRRVPNLRTFFDRAGGALAITQDPQSFQPGDLVTWTLPGNLPHIGIVTDQLTAAGTPLIVHNVGRGPTVEDVLFAYPITGHYRYALD